MKLLPKFLVTGLIGAASVFAVNHVSAQAKPPQETLDEFIRTIPPGDETNELNRLLREELNQGTLKSVRIVGGEPQSAIIEYQDTAGVKQQLRYIAQPDRFELMYMNPANVNKVDESYYTGDNPTDCTLHHLPKPKERRAGISAFNFHTWDETVFVCNQ